MLKKFIYIKLVEDKIKKSFKLLTKDKTLEIFDIILQKWLFQLLYRSFLNV
jgi:hypothetical protein